MIYMFLADGFEETEALVTLDMLRRAGIEIKTAGVGSVTPRGAHAITVTADMPAEQISFDSLSGIILPGGMPGTENLYADDSVIRALDYCVANGLLVAAICAAPIIPGRKGYLSGKKAVCYPGFENELQGADLYDGVCVTDGNIITAKGAGCVFEFSYDIISFLLDDEKAIKVIKEIQHKGLT